MGWTAAKEKSRVGRYPRAFATPAHKQHGAARGRRSQAVRGGKLRKRNKQQRKPPDVHGGIHNLFFKNAHEALVVTELHVPDAAVWMTQRLLSK